MEMDVSIEYVDIFGNLTDSSNPFAIARLKEQPPITIEELIMRRGLNAADSEKLLKRLADLRTEVDIFKDKKSHDRGSEVGVPMSPEAIEAGNRAKKKYQEIFGGMVGEKSNEEFEVMP